MESTGWKFIVPKAASVGSCMSHDYQLGGLCLASLLASTPGLRPWPRDMRGLYRSCWHFSESCLSRKLSPCVVKSTHDECLQTIVICGAIWALLPLEGQHSLATVSHATKHFKGWTGAAHQLQLVTINSTLVYTIFNYATLLHDIMAHNYKSLH